MTAIQNQEDFRYPSTYKQKAHRLDEMLVSKATKLLMNNLLVDCGASGKVTE